MSAANILRAAVDPACEDCFDCQACERRACEPRPFCEHRAVCDSCYPDDACPACIQQLEDEGAIT